IATGSDPLHKGQHDYGEGQRPHRSIGQGGRFDCPPHNLDEQVPAASPYDCCCNHPLLDPQGENHKWPKSLWYARPELGLCPASSRVLLP
ncbi:unnamed protein product, partial [Symbiodinium necroappetens]